MEDSYFARALEYQDYVDNKDELNPETVVFIEQSGKEKLIAQNKEYNFVPGDGDAGQMLMQTAEGPKWDSPFWIGTLIEYEALGKWDDNKLYFIEE